MLIHLIPRMYACRTTEPCTLVDLTCEELGLHLQDGKEITARRPYPNKDYLVACRKAGQKAIKGILVESETFLSEFNVVTRWADQAGDILMHQVTYQVLDREFDTITDDMTIWFRTHPQMGDFGDRVPDGHGYTTPAECKPRMSAGRPDPKGGNVLDTYSATGKLVERVEVYRVPTIERERLCGFTKTDDRMPSFDSAFVFSVVEPQPAALVG